MPILALIAAGAGLTYWQYNKKEDTSHPASGGPSLSLNLTTIAGYAIAGGLVYYFGKKLLSA